MVMKVEILQSCMFSTPEQMLERCKNQCDTLVINQADTTDLVEWTPTDRNGEPFAYRFMTTTERGLSRSRNMAINNSYGDVCVLCDDDEILEPDIKEKVASAFEQYPEADVIAFQVTGLQRKPADHPFRASYLHAMRFASVQLAFRLKSIQSKGIRFDEKMGSGTGNGCGEENKFMFDCLKSGLRMQYVPVHIATLIPSSESQWWNGFTKEFFINRGWATRRYMGWFLATAYAAYYAFVKRKKYDMPVFKAFSYILRGIYVKPQ